MQVFFRYKTLLERDLQELAALVSRENGKTLSEGVAEIGKCIELTGFATSLPQLARLKAPGLYTFVRWNYVFIAPPLCITREQLDEGLAMISDALTIADAQVTA